MATPLEPPTSNPDLTQGRQGQASVQKVTQDTLKKRPLFEELSTNRGWTLGLSPTRLVNPDILVGRKGLKVYTEMRRDDQIKAALALKKHAILSTGWRVVPPEPENSSPRMDEMADFVDHVLRHELEGDFDDDLLEILTALDYGYSVTEVVYKPLTMGKWRGKIGVSKLATRLPHHFVFKVDTHDNLLPEGIEQFGKPFPASRFLLFSHGKEFDNLYGRSDLHEAYQWWWFKTNTIKWWSIFMDRYGIPLAEAITQPSAGLGTGDITRLQSILDNLQANTAFIHPSSVEVRFPTVGAATGSSIFDMAIMRADRGIAKAILIPSLLGVAEQGDVGSYSQSRTQFDVFVLVVEAIQRRLARYVIGSQLIRRLVDLNYVTEEYPKFEFLPFTETDKMNLISQFNQLIAAGVVQPRPEDEVHGRALTQFPKISVEEIKQEQEQQKMLETQMKMAQAQATAQAQAQGAVPGQPLGPEAPPEAPGRPPGSPPAPGPGPTPPSDQEIEQLIQSALASKTKKFAQDEEEDDGRILESEETDALVDLLLESDEELLPLDEEHDYIGVEEETPGLDPAAASGSGSGDGLGPDLEDIDRWIQESEENHLGFLLSLPFDEEIEAVLDNQDSPHRYDIPALQERETIQINPQTHERGVWRTIHQRKIFIPIKQGESVPEAISRVRKEWNWSEMRGRKTDETEVALNELPWATSPDEWKTTTQELNLDPETVNQLTPTAIRYQTPDGWEPGRTALHRRIQDQELAAFQSSPARDRYLANGGKPKLLILAGGIGNGARPSVLPGIFKMDRKDIVQIIPSEIQRQLPEFQTLSQNPQLRKAAALVTQSEAQMIAQGLLNQALNRRADIVLDSTLAHPDQAKKILKQAQENGYDVRGVFVDSPPAEALGRQRKRAEKKPEWYQPDLLVERSHQFARASFEAYKGDLNGWAVYRTYRSTGKASPPPTLVAQGGKSGESILNESLWKDFQGRPTHQQPAYPRVGWHLPDLPKTYKES